jgi:hypothetical protein
MAPIELRYSKLLLNQGFGEIPAVGSGTLIPDHTDSRIAIGTALETGFQTDLFIASPWCCTNPTQVIH